LQYVSSGRAIGVHFDACAGRPMRTQSVIGSSAPIRHPPPSELPEVGASRDALDPSPPDAAEPPSDAPSGAGGGGASPLAGPNVASPPHPSVTRSEFGATQAFVHAASLGGFSLGPGGRSSIPEVHVVGHWQVHVEGQSESTVQGGVCCDAQTFHVT
jgi:hypothetical protein